MLDAEAPAELGVGVANGKFFRDLRVAGKMVPMRRATATVPGVAASKNVEVVSAA
jgi:hypothetical protein